MPLPPSGPVAFRGVPSLGANQKVALTMTFTQKQVEAMFARQATLRQQGSSECPFEIDFDENKMYIGDIATPFTRVKEDGTREICQRSPTVSKPLAGITLAGNVIGKLNIQRDYDQDIADNIRKMSEAEESKRKERHIVRLDKPPVMPNGKKSRTGSSASSLAKKAMSNRISSAQATSSRPSATGSRPSTPTTSTTAARAAPASSSPASRTPPSSSTRPTPPHPAARPSTPSSSTTPATSSLAREPDLTSLRSHLLHYLALGQRTTQDVLFEIGGRNPTPETVREIEDTLTAVAEEIPPPKKGVSGPVMWQLRMRSWEQIRPYEYPSLDDAQRKNMARKGRLALGPMGVPHGDPLWDHFKTRNPSDTGMSATTPSVKGKAKAGSAQPLMKTSDFKGGMFPKEKKTGTKGGGVASGGVTKTKVPTAKSKAKKEAEDEVEVKVRKITASLKSDTKGNVKAGVDSSSTSTRLPKTKQPDEEEVSPTSTKARSSLGTIKKEHSPLPPKARRVQDQSSTSKRKHPPVDTDADSEMEEGEVPVKPEVKKRRVTVEVERLRVPPKQNERRETSTNKTSKEDEKAPVKDQSSASRQIKDGNAPGMNAGAPSKAAAPGNKVSRLDKGREREMEREKEKEREKRRSNGKGRRRTPSFSSDEEEADEDTKPLASSRVASVPKQKQAPPSSKPASAPAPAQLPRTSAPSSVLPTDKGALRRRYHTCYARYMGITSKFHEERAKIEAVLEPEDGSSADEDADMMDAEQLLQLRGEHERLRDELERITHAFTTVY